MIFSYSIETKLRLITGDSVGGKQLTRVKQPSGDNVRLPLRLALKVYCKRTKNDRLLQKLPQLSSSILAFDNKPITYHILSYFMHSGAVS
jgi:hypothetical protein